MNKLMIPAILAATVLVAGIFAFMPVEQASTVHTTIQASTTHLVDTTVEATASGDNFLITCPATSDGCIINEIYVDNENADVADVDLMVLKLNDQDNLTLAVDGDNGNVAQNGAQAVIGASGLAIGAGDAVCLDMTGTFTAAGNAYSIKVIATVEGDLNDITVVRQAGAC